MAYKKNSLVVSALLLSICASQTSCTSITSSRAKRGIASINNYPNVVETAYFPENRSFHDFIKEIANKTNNPEMTSDGFLENEAPFYNELSALLEETIDDVHRAYPESKKAARPKLVIVSDPSPNAFVTATFSCSPLAIEILGAKPVKKVTSHFGYQVRAESQGNVGGKLPSLSPWQSVLNLEEVRGESCFNVPDSRNELPRVFANTSVGIWGNAGIAQETSKGVTVKMGFSEVNWKGANISLERTVPFIFVHAGLLSSLNSYAELKSVLAHELGHYYLGHAFTPTKVQPYFYDRSNLDQAFRPPEEKSLNAFGKDLLKAGYVTADGGVPPYYGSKTSAAILVFTIDFLNPSGLFPANKWSYDKKLCYPLMSGPLRADFQLAFKTERSSSEQARLEASAAKMKSCLESVKIKKGGDPRYYDLFTSMSDGKIKASYFIREEELNTSKNAWQAFEKIDKKMTQKILGMYSNPALKKIGYYTQEEEADVFATNLFLTQGKDFSGLQNALISMIEGSGSNLDRETKACVEAYRNGWKLGGAEYQAFPTDFTNFHHGLCYRLFNISESAGKLGMKKSVMTPAPSKDFSSVKNAYRKMLSKNIP